MGVAGWRGGTTDLCPGRQKPWRRHCDRRVVASDLYVGCAAIMPESQRFEDAALFADELVELVDTDDVVGEGDDADAHCVVVDVERERQCAGEVHDEVVLDAARQVQHQHDVHH